jgi:hypothetical protein
MITVKETTNRAITIKDAYMDGNVLVDEDGTPINIYELLQSTYGDGVQFKISVSAKANNDLNG